MKPKHRRLVVLLACLAVAAIGITLLLRNLQNELVFFYTPTQLQALEALPTKEFRLGGLVKTGSIEQMDGDSIRFVLTDLTQEMTVTYRGMIPALFKEGKGAVALGTLQANGSFKARQLLAKHDENYMPPALEKQLRESGKWQHYSPEDEKTYAP